jgi:hypothetical protein
MSVPIPAPRPETPTEWREHAEALHGRGLELVDVVGNMRDTPAEVAQAHALLAQTFFVAAQSAIALAGRTPERPPAEPTGFITVDVSKPPSDEFVKVLRRLIRDRGTGSTSA